MIVFDIGALLFLFGFYLFIRFLFFEKMRDIKSQSRKLFISSVIQTIGGIIMFVSYYILLGNKSFISNLLTL